MSFDIKDVVDELPVYGTGDGVTVRFLPPENDGYYPLTEYPTVELTVGGESVTLDRIGVETLGRVLLEKGFQKVQGLRKEAERLASLELLVEKLELDEGIDVVKYFVGAPGEWSDGMDQLVLKTFDDVPRVAEICEEHDGAEYALSCEDRPEFWELTTKNYGEDRFITFVNAESGEVRREKVKK